MDKTKKVLIAEDNTSLREAYIFSIEINSPSAIIDAVGTYKELIEKAKSNKYNLIITDYVMEPGTNGIEAITEIREFDKKTPICMISGSMKSKEALENGATYYIEKSTSTFTKDLENLINKYLVS